ncbi:MAG: precorrin-3B C(17)-methyltransferase [Chloroflexota bacterium]
MQPAILYITKNGRDLATRLLSLYPNAVVKRFRSELVRDLWPGHDSFIFIMAAGIVARTIAPLFRGKRIDPAVVVLDEKGRFAVSLLSGHLGGANRMAKEIAGFLGGEPVITTASDINDVPSIDLWAQGHDLIIEDWDAVPRAATKLLNEGRLDVFADTDISLPAQFTTVGDPSAADVVISNRTVRLPPKQAGAYGLTPLVMRPKNLVAGIGCNSGTPAKEIADVVRRTFESRNLSVLSVRAIATLDRKGNEPGLIEFAKHNGLDITCYTPEELNEVKGITKSDAALRATGARAVAEPAALLASGNDTLLVPKQKIGNVTIAVAVFKPGGAVQEEPEVRHAARTGRGATLPEADKDEQNPPTGPRGGILYIVGTGPGGAEHITPRALRALMESDVIIGYGTYLGLIQDLIKDKQIVSTGMTQEVARGTRAIDIASTGKTVSVISGGDPGIYAMAGLIFELLRTRGLEATGRMPEDRASAQDIRQTGPPLLHIEVIPGISALNACAARLGAPLMHDFSCISLSDRLTPWDLIEKRLAAAASADFVIVLYNPRSKGRATHIDRAREVVMHYRAPGTPVGIVRAAMREDEQVVITTLERMLDHDIDMQTTVVIGNSQTFSWGEWLVTPRGYRV